jgi:hypothetical protein
MARNLDEADADIFGYRETSGSSMDADEAQKEMAKARHIV